MPQVHRKTQKDVLLDWKYSSEKNLHFLRADCRARLHSGAIFAGVHGQRRIILVLSYSDHPRLADPPLKPIEIQVF